MVSLDNQEPQDPLVRLVLKDEWDLQVMLVIQEQMGQMEYRDHRVLQDQLYVCSYVGWIRNNYGLVC